MLSDAWSCTKRRRRIENNFHTPVFPHEIVNAKNQKSKFSYESKLIPIEDNTTILTKRTVIVNKANFTIRRLCSKSNWSPLVWSMKKKAKQTIPACHTWSIFPFSNSRYKYHSTYGNDRCRSMPISLWGDLKNHHFTVLITNVQFSSERQFPRRSEKIPRQGHHSSAFREWIINSSNVALAWPYEINPEFTILIYRGILTFADLIHLVLL